MRPPPRQLRPAWRLSIDLNGGGLFTDRMVQIIALITVLSIAPSILIMMTCFVRMVVVLSLLRTALGLQTSPPNSVMVSLAHVPHLVRDDADPDRRLSPGIEPMMNNQVTTEQGFTAAMVPMKKFMLAHVRDADLKLFLDMAHAKPPASPSRCRADHPGAGLHAVANSSAPSKSAS